MVRYIANGLGLVSPLKTKLVYTLKKAEHNLIFQVNEQSQDITDFLANNTYRAKNGMVIAADQYPEFQESGKNGNMVVYLQGSDTLRSRKIDTTRFVGNMQRDAKAAMLEAALAEFVDFMKSLKPVQYYAPKTYNCNCEDYLIVLA